MKSGYKDYASMSDYFTDENKEMMNKDIHDVEKQKKFIVWVQEFSKKIIIVVFALYIIMTLFCAYVVYKSWQLGIISGIDTLISEINNTFRDIVGGYIIKSAVENAIKIGGNYYVGIIDAKLKSMKHDLKKKDIIEGTEDTTETVNFNEYDV